MRFSRDGDPWSFRVRALRTVGRTRLGYRFKRALRGAKRRVPHRQPGAEALPPRQSRGPVRAPRNIVLVSHGDLTSNSGGHVSAIATELAGRGYSPIVALPGRPRPRETGPAGFAVVGHRELVSGGVRFPDGQPADLVHAFTPRAPVRRATVAAVRAAGCAYVVHLEDDDALIAGGTPAVERDAFVAGSAGVTVVVDALLELKPDGLPGAVVWPGFDDAMLEPKREPTAVRSELGLSDAAVMLVYNGNVHETNLAAMRELYSAVAILRERGTDAVLVKTGWNFMPGSSLPRLAHGLRDLGWVARARVPELLSAADVLVQPGAPGGFDDYRFPSKLPEFLASGRPVVLPRANIGLHLRDGEEALLLEQGDADEITEKILFLADDAERANAIGERGRTFALRRLRWSTNVERIVELYSAVPVSSD